MGLGDNLKKILNERNINANELANRIDVPASTIYSMIHRNSKKADIEILIRIANELKISADDLLRGEETEPYYINPETSKLAQQAFEDPDTRILMSAKRDLSPESMKAVIDMVKLLRKKENPHEEVYPDDEYFDISQESPEE